MIGRCNYHAGIAVGGADAAGQLNWNCPADADLHIYVDAGGDAAFDVTPGEGTTLIDKDIFVHPLTNEVVINLGVAKGMGSLKIVSKSGGSYRADAYLSDPNAKFVGDVGKAERLVGTPGTSTSAHHGRQLQLERQVRSRRRDSQSVRRDRQGKERDDDRRTLRVFGAWISPDRKRREAGDRRARAMVHRPRPLGAQESGRVSRHDRPIPVVQRDERRHARTQPASSRLLLQKKPKITLGEIKDLTAAMRDHRQLHRRDPQRRLGLWQARRRRRPSSARGQVRRLGL